STRRSASLTRPSRGRASGPLPPARARAPRAGDPPGSSQPRPGRPASPPTRIPLARRRPSATPPTAPGARPRADPRPAPARPEPAASAGRRRSPHQRHRPARRSGPSQGRCYTGSLPASPSRRPLPERRQPAGPPQTEGREEIGRVTDYEILLMLDPELPEDRQNEIVNRTQDLIKKSGGK